MMARRSVSLAVIASTLLRSALKKASANRAPKRTWKLFCFFAFGSPS